MKGIDGGKSEQFLFHWRELNESPRRKYSASWSPTLWRLQSTLMLSSVQGHKHSMPSSSERPRNGWWSASKSVSVCYSSQASVRLQCVVGVLKCEGEEKNRSFHSTKSKKPIRAGRPARVWRHLSSVGRLFVPKHPQWPSSCSTPSSSNTICCFTEL